MATVRDRNGQTYKAPVFLVRNSPPLSISLL
jgi:vacuolar protein sorting-associated protein 26